MRLNYNILWIENEKSWLDSTKALIQDYVEELGFRLFVKPLMDGVELDELLKIEPHLEKYDLILVDYALNNSKEGNELIKRIRSNDIYTDILFYSQDVDKMRKAFNENNLEGVFTSSREDFEDRFIQIMKTTIKKVEEVSTLRGLIMAETSTLDEMMLSIIKKYLVKADAVKKNEYIEYLFKNVEESVSRNCKYLKELKDKKDINTLIDTPLLFTLSQKSLGINKIIKQTENGEIKKFKGYHEDFNKKIIQTRNTFAHVEEKEEDSEIVLINTKGMQEVFSSERCVEIRKDILSFSGKLKEIEANIDLS